ncbi:Cytoplasmic dynein 2 heavy chain 1 [Pelomyxa schiedti]|nr:Cytoplasmic dynein 2 heavy chain 1 [Pelomyxa schiedti]
MGMIFMDETDVDIKEIVSSWSLTKLPDETREKTMEWVNTYFYRALDYVRQFPLVVETTLVGLVKTGLIFIENTKNKGEFLLGLMRGLGSNLALDKRAQFGCIVLAWGNLSPIDRNAPWECVVDPSTGSINPYSAKMQDFTVRDLQTSPIVHTASSQALCDSLMVCLKASTPLILVGPVACGKSTILQNCFSQMKSTTVATLACNAHTMSSDIIQKMNQVCVIQSSSLGRVYRPKDTERLVLWIKDINLPKPDNYETVQLISFLQQLISYNGFYDQDNEHFTLDRIQLVCTMAPITAGRHPVSTRFTANTAIFFMDYPKKDHLLQISTAYLAPVMGTSPDVLWRQPGNIQKLASTMLSVFSETQRQLVQEQQSRSRVPPHYIFTPRDLTNWILGLLRYQNEAGTFFEVFKYEAYCIFASRLVAEVHKAAFNSIISTVLKRDWQTTVELKELYFTSWAATETLGKTKKLAKTTQENLHSHVSHAVASYSRDISPLEITLFPDVLTHLASVDRVLSTPGGSLLLVGNTGVGRGTAVALSAYMHRMQVFCPNTTHHYNMKAFSSDLKNA